MSLPSLSPAIKDRFLQLLLEAQVLRFGSFTTKSGRSSPFFFNTGRFDSGLRLGLAGELYAQVIAAYFGDQVDNVYGPAYKGIPLAVVSADRLAPLLGRDITFTFNRKETKAHGEGGQLVGHVYQGGERVVVVEDVLTGGTSLRETMPLLQRAGVKVLGVVLGIDREERGLGRFSARREIEEEFAIPVVPLLRLQDIVSMLHGRPFHGRVHIDDAMRAQIDTYQAQYGARE